MHQGIHMVWKQTSVPSLSKMTKSGLKKAGFSLASNADGDDEIVVGSGDCGEDHTDESCRQGDSRAAKLKEP